MWSRRTPQPAPEAAGERLVRHRINVAIGLSSSARDEGGTAGANVASAASGRRSRHVATVVQYVRFSPSTPRVELDLTVWTLKRPRRRQLVRTLAEVRVFFTGGSGKAGRHAIRYLVEQGHRVVNGDMVPLGDPGVADLRIDLTDAGQVFNALRRTRALMSWSLAPAFPGTTLWCISRRSRRSSSALTTRRFVSMHSPRTTSSTPL